MLSKEEIGKKVKEIFSRELGIKEESIGLEKRLVDDLGMDSFAATELIFAIEKALRVEIPEEDISNLNTINDVIEYLTSRIHKNK